MSMPEGSNKKVRILRVNGRKAIKTRFKKLKNLRPTF